MSGIYQVRMGPPVPCTGCGVSFTPNQVMRVHRSRAARMCPVCIKREKKEKNLRKGVIMSDEHEPTPDGEGGGQNQEVHDEGQQAGHDQPHPQR